MAEYGGISMEEYCKILFADLGYHESSQRRGWLKLRFGKSYLDEMNQEELHHAVQELRREKYGEEEV
jgi:hypothetical protein